MHKERILDRIGRTGSPLKRQLLTASLVSGLLQERGKSAPVIIGGCALSYYSREVYFTADIDFAYADTESLDAVLQELGFLRKGRYWLSEDLKIAIEVPTSTLAGEDSPLEVVEVEEGLRCTIIGLEDLIIDRLNACRHWNYETDCEMAELLVKKYSGELDWGYLEKKADEPANDTLELLKKYRDIS